LADELYKELSVGHILSGEEFIAVAKRIDRDDVLFKLKNKPDTYAEVHLTWSGQPEKESHWPKTTIYPSCEEWARKMLRDVRQYSGDEELGIE